MNKAHFEDRHPAWASALGGLVGLGVWWGVFYLLLLLGAWILPPARSEGKGGPIVEAIWLMFAGPFCVVIGAAWPLTLGRRFRRPKSNQDDAD
ncbi:MAG: hypothetical protein ACKVU4_06765 [Phycisphaerales bacterium]